MTTGDASPKTFLSLSLITESNLMLALAVGPAAETNPLPNTCLFNKLFWRSSMNLVSAVNLPRFDIVLVKFLYGSLISPKRFLTSAVNGSRFLYPLAVVSCLLKSIKPSNTPAGLSPFKSSLSMYAKASASSTPVCCLIESRADTKTPLSSLPVCLKFL